MTAPAPPVVPVTDPDLARLERLMVDQARTLEDMVTACSVFSANPSRWIVLLPRVRVKAKGERLVKAYEALLRWEEAEIAASDRRMGPLR